MWTGLSLLAHPFTANCLPSMGLSMPMGLSMASNSPWYTAFYLPKSRADYNRFFTIVKEEMQNLGLTFQPTAIMSDFELAFLQALELQFPNTQILGCLFYFSQCLWRKVQSLGLASLYTSDSAVKSFVHKAAALAFLPPMFVRVAWSGLKASPYAQRTTSAACD